MVSAAEMAPARSVYAYFAVSSVVLLCWQQLSVALASVAVNAALWAPLAWLYSPTSAAFAARAALGTLAFSVMGGVTLVARRAMHGSKSGGR